MTKQEHIKNVLRQTQERIVYLENELEKEKALEEMAEAKLAELIKE